MIQVGLTGGIGSGKSTCAKIFESLDVPVFYADEVAKEGYSDSAIRAKVEAAFGVHVYTNNKLNRKELASKVFTDPQKLSELNGIIHPYVAERYERWVQEHQEHPYVIKEAAIIFETGGNETLDKTITVSADEALRVERVCKRDNVDEDSVKKRIAAQWSEEKRVELADYVIDNNGTTSLITQVLGIHSAILSN